MQWLRHGWLPILLLAVFSAQYLAWLDFQFLPAAKLPPILLGTALALGILFKASRLAYSAALILVVYLSVDAVPWLDREGVFSLCLALVSLNIALLSFTRDRNPLSGSGVLLILAVLGQGLGLYFLQRVGLSLNWSAELTLPFGGDVWVDTTTLVFICALLLLFAKVCLKPETAAFGLLTCTLLLYLVRDGQQPRQLQLAISVAGLLLTLQVLHSAYELAFRDELTGIPSRRAYSRYLLTLGRHFMIAVIDIDHFKKLNDRYGHSVGDQALRMVAGKIARFGGGRAFRYGGEEFVVVFRGRDRESALQSLERMREKIAEYPLKLRSVSRDTRDTGKARRQRGQGGGGRAIKTTVSVGFAGSGTSLKSPDAVLEAADRALYKAKRAGRNRVCAQT